MDERRGVNGGSAKDAVRSGTGACVVMIGMPDQRETGSESQKETERSKAFTHVALIGAFPASFHQTAGRQV